MTELARVVVEGQGTFVRVRRPAYWLYVIVVGFGLVQVGETFTGAVREISMALWVAVMLNAILAGIFVYVLARMDLFEREPAAVRAAAFLWGALAATSLAIIANNSLLELLTKAYGVEFATKWGPAIAGPINEEWMKALGVVLLVLIVREHFNRALDGLIYGAFIGLGFQVVENLTYAIQYAVNNPNSDLAGSLSITLVRIFIAGPWSHPIYTGVAGLGIAFAVTAARSRYIRYTIATALFIAAWAAHFLWNTPMPEWVPGGLSLFFSYSKGMLILIFFFVLYRYAVHREWHWFGDIMKGQPVAIITELELDQMRTLRTRKKARNAALGIYGPQGKKLVGRLQRAQVELCEALARARRAKLDEEFALDVIVARSNVMSARDKLEAALTPGIQSDSVKEPVA